MKIVEEIRQYLFDQQDMKYREMQVRILPNLEPDSIIGVRTPVLRKYAGELIKREDVDEFLKALPHQYFDENQLHAFILSRRKDYDTCISEVNEFLPYVDNWATCDQMSPKLFKKHRPELLESIREWISLNEPYTIRFGIGMLMEHFLDEDFSPEYPEMVAAIRPNAAGTVGDGNSAAATSDPAAAGKKGNAAGTKGDAGTDITTSPTVEEGSSEYYIRMMIAWYFATALAKQYDTILPYIEEKRLDTWTHNKAIQKSIESYRITPGQKDYLRTLKIKKGKGK